MSLEVRPAVDVGSFPPPVQYFDTDSFSARCAHRATASESDRTAMAASTPRWRFRLHRLLVGLRACYFDSRLVRRYVRRSLGDRGESAAARYLRRHRLRIVARQVRDVFGEIDLVAIDGRTVVFVEVKTRRTMTACQTLSAVTPEKQRRISRSALRFMRRHDLLECAARFDVVAVIWPRQQRRPQVVHVANAFEMGGERSMFG